MRIFECDTNPVNHLQPPHCPRERGNSIRERGTKRLRKELMPMSNARAVRYRRLALATGDRSKADLLLKLADECDRGVLCTAAWVSAAEAAKS